MNEQKQIELKTASGEELAMALQSNYQMRDSAIANIQLILQEIQRRELEKNKDK